ncbi:MAG: diadenylate cyclase CdaA [Clostridiales bacterium]|nr:diadenylate cyclase CdaA [Clostridiales bacterium]
MSYLEEIMTYIKGFFSWIDFSAIGIPEIGLNTVIDILAVAFISYKIMFWIKETRAWSLFRGIIVVLFVSMVSVLFELNTISWMISSALNFGIVAVAVIFQPELRRALEQLGKGKIIAFMNPEDTALSLMDQTADEIITAVEKMAETRTGALIVVEKQVALGDLARSGIPIDAVVSSQLLCNIFVNKTPLHDGAVLIRKNKISAATCILPLTQTDVSADLGTRHRAALGASEVSDAVTVIVSEETGIISVAKGGRLYRGLSTEKLKNMLVDGKKLPKRKRNLWKGRKND